MSLVLELQQEASSQNVDILQLLRKALIVARKLKLSEFQLWISAELNGYEDNIPEYRKIEGSCRYFNPYHGWQDVVFPNEIMRGKFSSRKTGMNVSELENLIQGQEILSMEYSSEIQNYFAEKNYGMVPKLIVGREKIIGILDAVKTKILNWALDLEERGILGENMSFNEKEKQSAKSVTINNYIGHIENSQMQQGDYNSIKNEHGSTDIEIVKELVIEIKKILIDAELSLSKKEEVQADIATVEIQLKSPSPKMMIVKECFKSVRNVLENASGNVLASSPMIVKWLNQVAGNN